MKQITKAPRPCDWSRQASAALTVGSIFRAAEKSGPLHHIMRPANVREYIIIIIIVLRIKNACAKILTSELVGAAIADADEGEHKGAEQLHDVG